MSPLPINRVPVRRALVSVYDKTGLDDLVRGLHEAGVALVSTGGSAARIESLGIPVTKVEDLTGFPECLDGRVKTLHPKVHAGILADRRLESHVQQLAELGVEPFDLVVSNLYPFRQTVASGATPDECVEQIDIGGPSMVRAAAKNHPSVAIVTSPCVVRRGAGRGRRRRVHPRAAPAAGRRGLRAHRGVRRRRRRLDGLGARAAGGRVLLPGVRRRDVHQGRRPEVRREPAPAGRPVRRRLGRAGRAPSRCSARRCPTTTTSTPTPPAGPRGTSPSRPSRSSSTPTRAASRSAPTSPRRTGGPTSATRSRRSAA